MSKSTKLMKAIYVSGAVLSLVLPIVAFAAPLPTPTLEITGSGIDLAEIETRIRQVANFLIVISLVVAVVFIVIGAIYWMSAMGDEVKAKKARQMVTRAVIGAAIVLAIGVILQTVAKLVTRTFFG